MKPHCDCHSKPSHFLATRPIQTLESRTEKVWLRAWTHALFVFIHLFGYLTVTPWARSALPERIRQGWVTGSPRSWWSPSTSRRSQQGCRPLPASCAPQQPALPSVPFPQFSLCFSSTSMAEQLLSVKLRAVFHLLGFLRKAGSNWGRHAAIQEKVFSFTNLTKNLRKAKLCSSLLHPNLHSSTAQLQAWAEGEKRGMRPDFVLTVPGKAVFAFSQHRAGHLHAFKQGRKLLLSAARTHGSRTSTAARGCWVPPAPSRGMAVGSSEPGQLPRQRDAQPTDCTEVFPF